MANAKGIDVSHHNGIINWSKVAADGNDFVFMKATEGTSYTDPKFASNWSGAKDAGLLRGAYHFFKPSDDGTLQAKHFLSHFDLKSGDLRPVVDVETFDGTGKTAILKKLKDFLDAVENATKAKPIIYTFKSFWKDSLGDPKNFKSYPLWIVDLSQSPPRLPSGWNDWTFWQHSFEGSASGINGSVDTDWYNGTKAQIVAMTIV